MHGGQHRIGKRAELEGQQLDQRLGAAFDAAFDAAFGAEHLRDGHVGLLRLRAKSGHQVVQLVTCVCLPDQLNVTQQRGELLPAVRAFQDRAQLVHPRPQVLPQRQIPRSDLEEEQGQPHRRRQRPFPQHLRVDTDQVVEKEPKPRQVIPPCLGQTRVQIDQIGHLDRRRPGMVIVMHDQRDHRRQPTRPWIIGQMTCRHRNVASTRLPGTSASWSRSSRATSPGGSTARNCDAAFDGVPKIRRNTAS